MRRLVDETTDELTRSLLSAGIEHQPPPGNKARVIMALGAGGALGLFSSNALAWLSTTTGKVTALGVAVGVAGAVWVAVPPAHEVRSSNDASGAKVAARLPAAVSNDPADGAPGVSDDVELGLAGAEGSITAGDASNAGANQASAAADGAAGANESSIAQGPADERRKGSSARRAARKQGARKASAKGRVAASELSQQRQGEPVSALEAPLAGGPVVEPVNLDTVDLDTEVRLVDSMHSAARRNDREALGRFLDRYRAAFPDGQLKKEVAEFAARLDGPDLSNPR